MRALATIAGGRRYSRRSRWLHHDPEVEPTQEVVDAAVTIAETNEFTSTNSASATGNLDINGIVSYLTQSSFAYVSDTYEVVPDESVRHHGARLRGPPSGEVHPQRGPRVV
jgi:hypothetical protein